jgi:hypothetical protein
VQIAHRRHQRDPRGAGARDAQAVYRGVDLHESP